ncbi:hypothetical protein AcW1_007785 [Taiwanofungus camphoratus]|nr:hypothetical protein AcW1_007785 [Antrodia cinnamomea]
MDTRGEQDSASPRTASRRVRSTAALSRPRRVVAVRWQVAVLNGLYQRAGENATKGDVESVAKETGLAETWIRKWIQRQRKSRARKSASRTQASSADAAGSTHPTTPVGTASFASQASCDAEAGSSTSIQIGLQENGVTSPCNSDANKIASEHMSLASGAPILVGQPGAAFSMPLRSAVLAAESSAILPFDEPSDPALDMRSLIQSPSLGCIPKAFPMSTVSTTSPAWNQVYNTAHVNNISTVTNNEGLNQALLSQRLLPSLPVFLDPPCQTAAISNAQTYSTTHLSQLLLEATNSAPPQPEFSLVSTPSSFLSALTRPHVSHLSFVTSLHSHSGSVGNSCSYPPPPIAYKTRFRDLTALTKRIRVTFDDAVSSAQDLGGVTDDTSQDALYWETDKHIKSRLLRLSHLADDRATIRVPDVETSCSERDEESDDDDDDDDDDELLTPSGEMEMFIENPISHVAPSKGKGEKFVDYSC